MGARFDPEDELAIQENRRAGGDPSKPTEITFWIYLPTESSVEAFVKAARQAGYSGSVNAPVPGDVPSGNPWGVLITRYELLTIQAITMHSAVLDSLAQQHGGEFDGWDADVTR